MPVEEDGPRRKSPSDFDDHVPITVTTIGLADPPLPPQLVETRRRLNEKDARAALSRLGKITLSRPHDIRRLADAQFRLQMWEAAADSYARAAELSVSRWPWFARRSVRRAAELWLLAAAARLESVRGRKVREVYERALADLERGLMLDAECFELVRRRSYVRVRLGDLEDGLADHRTLLRLQPDDPEVHYAAGFALARLGRYDDALTANDRALELRADFAEAWNNRGYILTLQREFADAREAYDRAIELNPKYPNAYTNRGLLALRRGQLESARADLDAALSLGDDDYALFAVGLVSLREGKDEDAVRFLRQALQLSPDYDAAWMFLAIALAHMGRLPESQHAHEKAIALRPLDPQAWTNYGATLARLNASLKPGLRGSSGLLQDALRAHRQAIALNPKYGLAHRNLGLTLANEKDYSHACEALETSFRLGVSDHAALATYAHALARCEQFESSLDILDRLLARTKHDAHSHHQRGYCLSRLQRYQEALSAFDRAVELSPNYSEAFLHRADTYTRLRKFLLALADYDRVIALGTTSANVHYRRARCLEALDRLGEAITAYDAALRLQPGHKSASRYRGRALARLHKASRPKLD